MKQLLLMLILFGCGLNAEGAEDLSCLSKAGCCCCHCAGGNKGSGMICCHPDETCTTTNCKTWHASRQSSVTTENTAQPKHRPAKAIQPANTNNNMPPPPPRRVSHRKPRKE